MNRIKERIDFKTKTFKEWPYNTLINHYNHPNFNQL